MSFFLTTCPWCRVSYYTGVVGTQMVGDRHACGVEIPCDYDGCTLNSEWLCEDRDGLPVYAPPTGPLHFRCTVHMSRMRVLTAHSPRLPFPPPAFVDPDASWSA